MNFSELRRRIDGRLHDLQLHLLKDNFEIARAFKKDPRRYRSAAPSDGDVSEYRRFLSPEARTRLEERENGRP